MSPSHREALEQTEASPWPADAVQRWPIEKLTPYPRNARTHSDAQVEQIAAAIGEWGWTNPILVAEDGTVIAGHGRLLAAKRLGLAEVPVMIASGWSEEQKRSYVIADNKLALNAGWDVDLLALELGELGRLGVDLSVVGFSTEELAALLDTGQAGLTDPDDVPEIAQAAISRPADLWLLGDHRLLCGDSTLASDVSKVLGATRPLLMVTDPPYGVDYDPSWRADANKWKGSKVKLGAKAMGRVFNDHLADWTEAWEHFPGDVAYVWHGGLRSIEQARGLEQAGFVIRSQIIWDKTRLVTSRGDYHWRHEACWYAVRKGKKGHWNGSRTESTVWAIPKSSASETGHGTQKPVECMRRPIENNSLPGQAVYEPFCGSGTTIIAAQMTGRVCHAIELNPLYVDVAIKRFQAFTGHDAILIGGGQTFDVIAAERTRAAA